MDYFQGIVTDYLRADRSMYVNTECLIQLEPGDAPKKGSHWYCDTVAVDLRNSVAYLCEVTYSSSLHALIGRLGAWDSHWPSFRDALARDCSIPKSWLVQPWLFLPEDRIELLNTKLDALNLDPEDPKRMPAPRVTFLESVVPWKYKAHNREVAHLVGQT